MMNETEIAMSLFKEDGPSELLKCIDKGENLSPEAQNLLVDIGVNMLTTILDDACFSANSRGSKIIEKSDVQFICDPWVNSENKKAENEEENFYNENQGSPEHRARLEMINKFKNNNDQQFH